VAPKQRRRCCHRRRRQPKTRHRLSLPPHLSLIVASGHALKTTIIAIIIVPQYLSHKHNAKFDHSAINRRRENQMVTNLQTLSRDLDHAYFVDSR